MLSRSDNMLGRVRELCPERERTETITSADRGAIHLLLSMKHSTLKGNEHAATGMEMWGI